MLALLGAGIFGCIVGLVVTDRDPGHAPTVLATAVVAVVVAGITAVTTDRRQERQLAHERATLTSRFAHERVMHDLEELRGVIDQAQVTAATLAGGHYIELVRLTKTSDAGAHDAAEEWWKDYYPALESLTRLELRIGHGHPVVEAYRAALFGLRDGVRGLRQMARAGVKESEIEDAGTGALSRFDLTLKIFTDRAGELIGTADEVR